MPVASEATVWDIEVHRQSGIVVGSWELCRHRSRRQVILVVCGDASLRGRAMAGKVVVVDMLSPLLSEREAGQHNND